MLNANPIKLDNGTWGAEVNGHAQPGTCINVIARSGKSWTAIVTSVEYRTGRGTVCATKSAPAAPGTSPRRTVGGSGRRNVGGSNLRRRECSCGWDGDMLSIGYRPGQTCRCPECGGKATAS